MSILAVFAPLLRPYETVADWLLTVVPPKARGLTVYDMAAQPTLANDAPKSQRLRLLVPQDMLLLRHVVVPEAVVDTARVRSYVAAKLEDISPWTEGDFLWDIRPDPAATAKTDLILAMIPVAPLRRFEAQLREACVVAELISPATPDRPAFIFRADQAQHQRWRNRILALSAALFGLGLAVTFWQGKSVLDARAETAAATQTIDRLASEAVTASAQAPAALALLPRKTEAQSFAHVLTLLARRLPDESWLDTLTIEPGKFEIGGHSTRPDAIIPALAADPAFAEVDFAGSSALDPQTGLFTFTIKSRVSGMTVGSP